MKNLKKITAIAAVTVAAAVTLTACGVPAAETTATVEQQSSAATADYVPASYVPEGYSDEQWEIILEEAAYYGVPEYDAEALAEIALAVWDDGGEADMCSAYYVMSESDYQDALLTSAALTFDSEGEAVVTALLVYALTLNYC